VPLHVHDRYDEAFYVLAGEVNFVVGGTTSVAEVGAFVFVPRGEAHRFWNESPTPARMLVIGSPQA
jgi:mannose-6-phosphate isomerase-like protein (cupin superfamily)